MKRIKHYLTAAVIVMVAIACSNGYEPVERVEMKGYSMTPLGMYTCVDIESHAYAGTESENMGGAGSSNISHDAKADAFEIVSSRTVTPLAYYTPIK